MSPGAGMSPQDSTSSGGGTSSSTTSGAPGARSAVRGVVTLLVQEQGRTLIDDPRRVEAFLRDLCGDCPGEIAAAVAALRSGVVADLHSGASLATQPVSLLLPTLAARLHDNLGIDDSLARWAVGTWALALGVADEAAVTASDAPGGQSVDIPASTGMVTGRAPSDPGDETVSIGPPSGLELETIEPAETAEIVSGTDALVPSPAPALPARWLRTGRGRAAVFVSAAVLVAAAVSGIALSAGGSGPGPAQSLFSPSAATAQAVFKMPRFGTYSYATSVTGGKYAQAGSLGPSTIDVVRKGSQVGMALTGFGETEVESDLYTFTPRSILLASTEVLTTAGASATTACVYSPSMDVYREPLTPGRSWSIASTCQLTVDTPPGPVKYKATVVEHFQVRKRQTVRVPFGTFRTVFITKTGTTTLVPTSGGTPQSTSMNQTANIDPTTTIPVIQTNYDTTTGQKLTAELEGFAPLASGGS